MSNARTGTGTPVRRPGIGIAIDRHKLKALRETALLERIDLSELTRDTELRQLAAEHEITGYPVMDLEDLIPALESRGVTIPRHIGVSRDAIAKIENGDRQRPKISTLRILIDTLNIALNRRGHPPIGIADLYAGTEHDGGGTIPEDNRDITDPD